MLFCSLKKGSTPKISNFFYVFGCCFRTLAVSFSSDLSVLISCRLKRCNHGLERQQDAGLVTGVQRAVSRTWSPQDEWNGVFNTSVYILGILK